MPLKDDLIQRTIAQLAEVTRALLRLQTPQAMLQAEAAIKKAYAQFSGSSAELFHQLSTEQILAVLSSVGEVDKDRAYLLASLFYAETELAKARGEQPSAHLQLKALDLFLEAATDDVDADDVHERIRLLRTELQAFALPELTHWRIFDYAQYTGRYAEAEDMLFGFFESYGVSERLKSKGQAFYKRLLGMKDADLAKGDLPRDEVEEGRLEFELQLAALDS